MPTPTPRFPNGNCKNCKTIGSASRSSKPQKCRFNFPRPLIDTTTIGPLGTVEIARNHVWINAFNPSLAYITESNHDVNFIPSAIKGLALVRYITNYATKGDCNQYERLMAALMAERAGQEARRLQAETGQYNAHEDGSGNHQFALKTLSGLVSRLSFACRLGEP